MSSTSFQINNNTSERSIRISPNPKPVVVSEAPNNNTSERLVKISPNPVSSILRVDLSGYTGNVTMQLVSLQGKTLKQEKMQAGVLKYTQQQMNITGIASGDYFLVVIYEKGNRQTEKVIIAR